MGAFIFQRKHLFAAERMFTDHMLYACAQPNMATCDINAIGCS